MTMTDKQVEYCKKSAFVRLFLDDPRARSELSEWVRVTAFDPEEKVLYVYNEDSGDEYSLEGSDLIGAKFYELKEI